MGFNSAANKSGSVLEDVDCGHKVRTAKNIAAGRTQCHDRQIRYPVTYDCNLEVLLRSNSSQKLPIFWNQKAQHIFVKESQRRLISYLPLS
jgi:hypothetical protein